MEGASTLPTSRLQATLRRTAHREQGRDRHIRRSPLKAAWMTGQRSARWTLRGENPLYRGPHGLALDVEEAAPGRLVQGIHTLMAGFYSANLATEINRSATRTPKEIGRTCTPQVRPIPMSRDIT